MSRTFPRNVREKSRKCLGTVQETSGNFPENLGKFPGSIPEMPQEISVTFLDMSQNCLGNFPEMTQSLTVRTRKFPGNDHSIRGKEISGNVLEMFTSCLGVARKCLGNVQDRPQNMFMKIFLDPWKSLEKYQFRELSEKIHEKTFRSLDFWKKNIQGFFSGKMSRDR